jgi:SAM-dependent methyltransferase
MLPPAAALAVFASAALLFTAQPLAGKQLLPLAGGTPAVWAACLVFFQGVLLLGYLYAHLIGKLNPAARLTVHVGTLAAGVAALWAGGWGAAIPALLPDDAAFPAGWVLLTLAVMLAGPAFALSATAPLVQGWFATTGRNPYPLYAASNAGSLLGLLGYPFLVEPRLPVADQRLIWAVGFGVAAGLVTLVGVLASGRREPVRTAAPVDGEAVAGDSSSGPAHAGRSPSLLWVALAAVPSSLLSGVTTHLTTDVAPVPLLWVVPLALYLLTFVVTFAGWPTRARLITGRAVPMLLLILTVSLLIRATEPLAGVAALHLSAFVAVCLLCHGELAHSRPPAERLTGFYLAISVGGVLGGSFNALLAPALFADLGMVEYPLALCLAALVRPTAAGRERLTLTGRDALMVLAFAALVAAEVFFAPRPDPDDKVRVAVTRLAVFGLPAAVAFWLVGNPLRFALLLGVMFVAGRFDRGTDGETLMVSRNFFGALKVSRSADGRSVRLHHGTTLHGEQRLGEHPPAPLMYYHRKGPVGRLVAKLPPERKRRVAVVGLGCGAMAAYPDPGQHWTFYEIDPNAVAIARDSGHFTFLAEARGTVDVVLGDARRKLAAEPDGTFGLIALDAFTSDAIPAHLLTAEAFELYRRKLTPDGVLAVHLSNRYLDLPPLVARVAAGLTEPFTLKLDSDMPTDAEKADGKSASDWAVLFRRPEDAGDVAKAPHWQRVEVRPGPTWRDDFSDLLGVWRSE